VAFASQNSIGSSQVFLVDSCGDPNNHIVGCHPTPRLLSTDDAGNPLFTAGSPSISEDGRFVVFTSFDSKGVSQVCVRDTCKSITGPIDTCPNASPALVQPPMGSVGSSPSTRSISGDGRFVLFRSVDETTFNRGVYVYDTCQTTAGPAVGCQSTPPR